MKKAKMEIVTTSKTHLLCIKCSWIFDETFTPKIEGDVILNFRRIDSGLDLDCETCLKDIPKGQVIVNDILVCFSCVTKVKKPFKTMNRVDNPTNKPCKFCKEERRETK